MFWKALRHEFNIWVDDFSSRPRLWLVVAVVLAITPLVVWQADTHRSRDLQHELLRSSIINDQVQCWERLAPRYFCAECISNSSGILQLEDIYSAAQTFGLRGIVNSLTRRLDDVTTSTSHLKDKSVYHSLQYLQGVVALDSAGPEAALPFFSNAMNGPLAPSALVMIGTLALSQSHQCSNGFASLVRAVAYTTDETQHTRALATLAGMYLWHYLRVSQREPMLEQILFSDPCYPDLTSGSRLAIAVRTGPVAEYTSALLSIQRRASSPGHVLLTCLVVLFWLCLVWQMDLWKKEPVWAVLLALGCGAISAGVVIPSLHALFLPQGPPSGQILSAFLHQIVYAAGLEELCKLALAAPLLFFLKTVDEPVDALIYGAWVGIGFAGIEHLQYLAGNLASISSLRMVTSISLHMAGTGILAFMLQRFRQHQAGVTHLVLAVIVVMVLHAVFNSASDFSLLLCLVAFFMQVVFFAALVLFALKSDVDKPVHVQSAFANLGSWYLAGLVVNLALTFWYTAAEVGASAAWVDFKQVLALFPGFACVTVLSFRLRADGVPPALQALLSRIFGVTFYADVEELQELFRRREITSFRRACVRMLPDLNTDFIIKVIEDPGHDSLFRYALGRMNERRDLQRWERQLPAGSGRRILQLASASSAASIGELLQGARLPWQGREASVALLTTALLRLVELGEKAEAAVCGAQLVAFLLPSDPLFVTAVDQLLLAGTISSISEFPALPPPGGALSLPLQALECLHRGNRAEAVPLLRQLVYTYPQCQNPCAQRSFAALLVAVLAEVAPESSECNELRAVLPIVAPFASVGRAASAQVSIR